MSIVFDDSYYKKIIREFGYDPLRFGEINFNLGRLSKEQLKTRWICHTGADKFAQKLGEKKAIVSTGIGLSAPPHVGTLTQILNAIFLQKAGIRVQMVLGDLDAYNGKDIPLQETRNLAKKYKQFMLKLGFKTTNGSVIRDQYGDLKVLRTMYLSGRYVQNEQFDMSEEDLHDFYVKHGKVNKHMTFGRKLSLTLMTADFIDLFLSDKYEYVLVMLGIDEHKYVLFAEQVLQEMIRDNLIRKGHLSAIYSHMNKGFNNHPKLSKSFPESSIHAGMTPDEIFHRIMYEEGEFEKANDSPVYQMMTSVGDFTLSELEKRHRACTEKEKNWKRYKEKYAQMIIEIFQKW